MASARESKDRFPSVKPQSESRKRLQPPEPATSAIPLLRRKGRCKERESRAFLLRVRVRRSHPLQPVPPGYPPSNASTAHPPGLPCEKDSEASQASDPGAANAPTHNLHPPILLPFPPNPSSAPATKAPDRRPRGGDSTHPSVGFNATSALKTVPHFLIKSFFTPQAHK